MDGTAVFDRDENILVVEDDEFSQQLIELYLRKAGFTQLTVANDGRQAISLAKEHAFDLVLLDLNLPRIGGAEVLRRLKKEGFLTETPVIVISSIANMEEIVHCLDIGADDYLPKPFNVRLLEGRVSSCLEKRRLTAAARDAAQRRERDNQSARRVQTALSGMTVPSSMASGVAWIRAEGPPAQEPGGDFHDLFPLADGSAVLILGTVAGTSAGTVLEIAQIRALARRAVDHSVRDGAPLDPGEALSRINHELFRSAPDPASASVLIASIDTGFDTLRLAAADAPAPLRQTPGEGPALLDVQAGCPLGLLADASYATSVHSLAAGERLVVFTNGLTGATNAAGLPFGIRRLAEALQEDGDGDPQSTAAIIAAAIRRHGERAPRPADATVLVVSRASGLSEGTFRGGRHG